MKAKLKALADALFGSPYLDKADIAVVVAAVIVLANASLNPAQQAAAVVVLGAAYAIAHKISNALTK